MIIKKCLQNSKVIADDTYIDTAKVAKLGGEVYCGVPNTENTPNLT